MSMLKELDLFDNSLTLRFTENCVPPFQLHTIRLSPCKLGPTFPKWIQTQKHLKDLDISNAGISDNVPEWFWAKLSSQVCRNINVSNNNLKGLIPNLHVKNHCYVLSLSSNDFEGPIPPFLRGSGFIDQSKNKFSESRPFLCTDGIDVRLIPSSLMNFTKLLMLDMREDSSLIGLEAIKGTASFKFTKESFLWKFTFRTLPSTKHSTL